MKREKKLIAYSKVLDAYTKADSFILTLLGQNRYEKHITDFGVGSAFFIFGYDISKFDEVYQYCIHDKKVSRKFTIKVLKECIKDLNKKEK